MAVSADAPAVFRAREVVSLSTWSEDPCRGGVNCAWLLRLLIFAKQFFGLYCALAFLNLIIVGLNHLFGHFSAFGGCKGNQVENGAVGFFIFTSHIIGF